MIPPIAQFIWLGADFPYIYGLSLRSAARRGEFREVVLHHTDPIEETPGGMLALDTPGVVLKPLRPEALLDEMGTLGGKLVDLYRELESPAARANVLRAALLYRDGGVYMDTDVITVTSMRPLLLAQAFCGAEHLVYSARLKSTSSIRRRTARLTSLALSTLRDGIRRMPRGYRWFQRIAWLYPTAVNNAVFGAQAAHPLVRNLLEAMVALPTERRLVRYALGTHLLQQSVAAYRGQGLAIHRPAVFFPLAPEISEHWFREQRCVKLEDALARDTRAAHWYASVRTRQYVAAVNRDYIRTHQDSQLFSRLVAPLVD